MTKDSLCMKCNREVERQKKEEEKALKIKMQEMAEKRRAEEEAERQKHTALRKEEWNRRRAGIAAFDDVPRVGGLCRHCAAIPRFYRRKS